jgi:hypothetical protein
MDGCRLMKQPHVDVNLGTIIEPSRIHGTHAKDLIVLHETVSGDASGTSDITSPARYLNQEGYGIHLVVDAEGKSGWVGNPNVVVYHAASGEGHVNTRSVGIEQVSKIPLSPSPFRYQQWKARRKQLDKVAQWCAWIHTVCGVPLDYSDSSVPGITTHWDVSHRWLDGHGHWDCWPKHKAGYYPVLYVVQKARNILKESKNV